MSDTKRLLIIAFVALWCLLSLPFAAHAQNTVEYSPLNLYSEPKCGEPVEVAGNTIVIKKKAMGSVPAAGGVGDGYTYIGSCVGNGSSSSLSTVSCDSTLTVATGDLLVGFGTGYGATTTIAIEDTGGANDFAMESVHAEDSLASAVGYLLAPNATGSKTFRVNLGAARTYVEIVVLQFRPTAGWTNNKSPAGDAYGHATSDSPVTAQFTTSQTNTMSVAFLVTSNIVSTNFSNFLIGGGAATGSTLGGGYTAGWYKALTGTSITAAASLTGSDPWSAFCLSFYESE